MKLKNPFKAWESQCANAGFGGRHRSRRICFAWGVLLLPPKKTEDHSSKMFRRGPNFFLTQWPAASEELQALWWGQSIEGTKCRQESSSPQGSSSKRSCWWHQPAPALARLSTLCPQAGVSAAGGCCKLHQKTLEATWDCANTFYLGTKWWLQRPGALQWASETETSRICWHELILKEWCCRKVVPTKGCDSFLKLSICNAYVGKANTEWLYAHPDLVVGKWSIFHVWFPLLILHKEVALFRVWSLQVLLRMPDKIVGWPEKIPGHHSWHPSRSQYLRGDWWIRFEHVARK